MSLEVIRITPDRWVAFAPDQDEALGYIERSSSLEPDGTDLYVAIEAEDGVELGIYRTQAGAVGRLEALGYGQTPSP